MHQWHHMFSKWHITTRRMTWVHMCNCAQHRYLHREKSRIALFKGGAAVMALNLDPGV